MRTNEEPVPRSDQHILWAIGAAAAVCAGIALLFGGLAIKVVAVVIAFAIIQGLWRGAAELAGIVAGLILAVPLAPVIGRGFEGAVSAATSTDGLMARFLAMGLAAVLIVAVVGVIVRTITKRALRSSPALRRWNPYLGAGLGLIEGGLLALVLLWAPLALEPIARAQLEPAPGQREPSPLAGRVVGFAEQIHDSALGPLAVQTNPIAGTELMSLAADFAAVSRDPEAMAWLMETPVMQQIEALPSLRDAVETVRGDPELSALLDERGASIETVKALLNSRQILELFDRTTIIRDMRPLAPRLAEAIREAKGRIRGPK
jgi:hypothetical protein